MMERDALGRIAKGRQLTAEDKLKIARGLSESWKKRGTYIGDIKNKNPRIFNSWRAIRFTKKGQKAGCDEQWISFRRFYNDVSPSYSPGLVLRRLNTLLPWGPANFIWVTVEEAGHMKAGEVIEYDGITLNLRQWADKVGRSYSSIKTRYYNRDKFGYTTKEVIYGREKKRGSKVAKDYTDEGVILRAKASKMIFSYRAKDIKNGLQVCDITIDWMVENILTQPCHYCGDTRRIGCDRIDNNTGHIKDNVVPCCVECNTARNNYFTYEEMRELGIAISKIKEKRRNE